MTQKCRLTLPVKIIEASIGCFQIPLILLSSWLEFLVGYNLWHILSGLQSANEARSSCQWESFWGAYEKICPNHPVFARARKGEIKLSRCAALLLHGDEGRSKKKQGILILSAHSVLGFGSHASYHGPEKYCKQKLNFLGHTLSSRWLLGVLPKTYYDDADGDTILQSYLDIFVQDILKVWERGIQGADGKKYHFVIINTMGDWPWLQKAFLLSRSFGNVSKKSTSKLQARGICHICKADMDGYPFEDFGRQPRWRETCNLPGDWPFIRFPSLMALPHDPTNPTSLIGQDIFHGWHLGAAKQFLASCLVLLSETYPGRSIPARFENMSADFFGWCRTHGEKPYIRKLNRDTVGWPSAADFPSASWSKGSTSTCVLRFFLAACVQRAMLIESGSLLEEALAAAKAIYRFLSMLFREDVWISSPKAVLNIMIWNCQIEEDYIGRPSRTSRRVGPGQVIRRTLQRTLQASFAKYVDSGFLVLSKA